MRLHEATVAHAWCDYNGHMSESSYLLVVGDNADAFFRYFGIDEEYRANGGSLYTAETHLHHLRECDEGDHLTFTLQVLGVDRKRVHIVHEVLDADDRTAGSDGRADAAARRHGGRQGRTAAGPSLRTAEGDRVSTCRAPRPRLRWPRHGASTPQAHRLKE